jgi:cyclin H
MTEDEIYRASTQYRLWNFTPEKLAERRTKTNALAIQQVKTAFKRKNDLASQLSSADASATASEAEGSGTNGAAKVDKEVECLNPEEEQKLVSYICSNLLNMVEIAFKEMPIHVVVS